MAFEGLSEKLNGVFKRLKSRGKLSEADVIFIHKVNSADKDALSCHAVFSAFEPCYEPF